MFARIALFAITMALTFTARAASPAFDMEVRGEGRPVYMIPGLASPGSVWDDLAAQLHELGYQTRVLTLAGFAGQPPLDGDTFLPVVRDALARELEQHEGPKPIVVGHSLGGFLAFWLAATEPDALAGIVAVDGVPYISALTSPDAAPASFAAQAGQIEQFMSKLTPEQYAAQNRSTLGGMISGKADLERMAASGGESNPSTVGRAVAEMMTTDLRPMMGDIQVPIVLIQAADSGASEARRDAYAAQVEAAPDVRHVVADKGLHFVPLDDPEFVAREVRGLLEKIENE